MSDELKGLVFDIQSFSVHDGPGSRTLVFLSGCPLRCEWCSNPEGLEKKQRFLFSSLKCRHEKTRCNGCLRVCKHNAISIDEDNKVHFNLDICHKCETHDCVDACIYEAPRMSGKWYTVDELMKPILRDSQFWSNGGGVTFSGGEALFQKDFLLAMLKECKKHHVHRAIETTAFAKTEDFLEVFSLINYGMIDIKHMDPVKHKEKTGVSNELIHKNISALAASDWTKNGGRLVLRMPIIQDFNDSVENALRTAEFMNKNGLFEINILSFHRLGESKWTQLGKEYKYKSYEPTSAEKMSELQDIYLDQGIACYINEEL